MFKINGFGRPACSIPPGPYGLGHYGIYGIGDNDQEFGRLALLTLPTQMALAIRATACTQYLSKGFLAF